MAQANAQMPQRCHLSAFTAGGSPSIQQMLAIGADQLSEQLDAQHGSEVSDLSIFRAHAAKYEVSYKHILS